MHIEVSRAVQLRGATQNSDRDLATQTLDRDIQLLTEVMIRLQEFNQPASQGWTADLELSRLLLKRSLFHRRMLVDGTDSNLEYATNDVKNAARLYFTTRLIDYRVGRASPVQIIEAAKYLHEQPADTLNSLESQPFQFRTSEAFEREVARALSSNDLAGAVVQVLPWRQTPAGRTSDDLLEILYSARTGETGPSPQESETTVLPDSRLLNDQFRRFQTGTASLSDMHRTWWLQQSVSLDDKGALNVSPAGTEQLLSIGQRASTLNDVRGRIAADLLAQQAMRYLSR